jgi:hypothetical protein
MKVARPHQELEIPMIKIAALIAIGLLAAVSTPAQNLLGERRLTGGTVPYVDVNDFGAKGYCASGTDDTPGIFRAAQHATALLNGNTVYLPPTEGGCYVIATPLILPIATRWTTMYLDSALVLLAPIIMNNYWILHGNTGNDPASFSQNHETFLNTFLPGNEAPIQIHGKWAVRLEYLRISSPYQNEDGILIDESSGEITLEHVAVSLYPTNLGGAALHIKGGGIINIIGGEYDNPAVSPGPSIEIEGDPNECSLMGEIYMDHTVLGSHGVRIDMHDGCGVFAQFEADDVLYEDGSGPFLQTVGTGGSLVAGVTLRNLSISDATANSTALSNTGQAWNFQVFNYIGGNNQAVTQGDTIQDLEIWSLGSEPVGQASQYVYHGMNGIVSTMPTISPEENARANMSKHFPNMNFKIPRFLRNNAGAPSLVPPLLGRGLLPSSGDPTHAATTAQADPQPSAPSTAPSYTALPIAQSNVSQSRGSTTSP